jgi:hypothetical protein
MSARRKLKVKGPKGKLRTRSMHEGIQGTTVRMVEDKQLPTGCCVLKSGIPCTYRMTHVEFKVERMWLPSEDAEVPVVRVLGYCKSHRPRNLEVIALGHELERRLNGPRTQKARIRKMEEAQYVNVVPQGGVVKHRLDRLQLNRAIGTTSWAGWVKSPITTACGKSMKQGYIPTLKEAQDDYPKDCPKCIKALTVVV